MDPITLFATVAPPVAADPYASLYAALATALATIITVAVTQLTRRFNVELSVEQQAKVKSIVIDGILLMEEKGRNALKAGLEALTPEEKFRGAIEYSLSHLPGESEKKIANLVLANMPAVRAAIVPLATAAVVKATKKASGRK
jgi:hypothetical protein